MSRALVLVLALVAAASAEQYAFNQMDEIIDRVTVCLKPVPESPSRFYTPGRDCTTKAEWSLEDGNTKETLIDSIPRCLSNLDVDAAVVATAKQCLSTSLPKKLKPALKEADYSDEQLSEISSRIAPCLTSIPEDQYHTPATDCRNEALNEAQAGYPKESLVEYFIEPCLKNIKNIKSRVVRKAKQCITKALAMPLSA